MTWEPAGHGALTYCTDDVTLAVSPWFNDAGEDIWRWEITHWDGDEFHDGEWGESPTLEAAQKAALEAWRREG